MWIDEMWNFFPLSLPVFWFSASSQSTRTWSHILPYVMAFESISAQCSVLTIRREKVWAWVNKCETNRKRKMDKFCGNVESRLRLYMEMYAVKRVASIHFSRLFVLFCLWQASNVMNDEMFLWWCNIFLLLLKAAHVQYAHYIFT